MLVERAAGAGWRTCSRPTCPVTATRRPTRRRTWQRMVDAVDRFHDERADGPVALCVHDWGGLIGLRWACDQPDKVRALVISASGFFPDGKWHGLAKAMRTEGQGEEIVDATTREGFGQMLAAVAPGISEQALDEYFKAYADPVRRRGQLELYRSGDFAELEPYRGRLAALVPTLLPFGSEEPVRARRHGASPGQGDPARAYRGARRHRALHVRRGARPRGGDRGRLPGRARVGLRDANSIRSRLRRGPLRSLVTSYPGAIAYPGAGFRLEWGPVFHRGRLDATARVLVIGQDPAQHETIARRILVGEAGHRLQGFLFKLGMDRSYVMVNTFLYSVFGSASKNAGLTRIATYRHKWLDALFAHEPIEAVVSLGTLADKAWLKWAATPNGQSFTPAYRHITHPTAPESGAAKNQGDHAALIKKMLANWNDGLQALTPGIAHPDKSRNLVLYGEAFADGDRSRSRWTTCRPASRRNGWPPTTAGPTAPAPAGASRRSR